MFQRSLVLRCNYICCWLVARSCLTLCDPVDCSPPGFSVHGILQARPLERAAIAFSRGPFQSMPPVLSGGFSTTEPPGKPAAFILGVKLSCEGGCTHALILSSFLFAQHSVHGFTPCCFSSFFLLVSKYYSWVCIFVHLFCSAVRHLRFCQLFGHYE